MPVNPFVQREDPAGEGPFGNGGKCFRVNFHTAVYKVNVAQQLRFRETGANGGPKFRLSVVGQDHVLQQQALFLRRTQLPADLGHLLGTHDQVAQKLPLERIVGDDSQVGKPEFAFLREVMEQSSGE